MRVLEGEEEIGAEWIKCIKNTGSTWLGGGAGWNGLVTALSPVLRIVVVGLKLFVRLREFCASDPFHCLFSIMF